MKSISYRISSGRIATVRVATFVPGASERTPLPVAPATHVLSFRLSFRSARAGFQNLKTVPKPAADQGNRMLRRNVRADGIAALGRTDIARTMLVIVSSACAMHSRDSRCKDRERDGASRQSDG
jgi:hypothetical protein